MGGHIRKRGKRYSVIIELGRDPESGERMQKSLGTYAGKKEAEKVLTEALYKMNKNEFILPEKTTVEEFLEYWLENHAKNLSPTTYAGYKMIITKHMNPVLGKTEIQKLQPMQIQKYYKDKSESLSGKTLLQHHRVLRKALDYAWKMQIINKNPADLVDSPKAKKYKAAVLTKEQAKILISEAKGTYLEIPIHFGLALGLRRGEILGLRWDSIDFIKGTIKIENTLVRAGTELIYKEPKTESSERILTAPKELMILLNKHYKKQLELKLRSKGEFNNEDNLVCTKHDGCRINPATFSHAFGDFLKRNNLPHVRLHDLRHTNATLMLLAGTPAKVASTRLGHSNISITMDLYSHVLEEMERDAADKLNDVIYK